MAIINLRAVENQFEKDADYIEIQMDDMQYLRIRKQYKVFTINEGKKSEKILREDTLIVEHWKRDDNYHDTNSWHQEGTTTYNIKKPTSNRRK